MMEKSKKSSRSGPSAHPEQEALRLAVKDKLPDAEIKARLDRAHEVQQQKEAQLARAQADLRAVLTVRQEAVAVLAGLLPP
jgi:adenosyl cobinamide kinase/adenosyl cobinamide phosphate guanylyltransferase